MKKFLLSAVLAVSHFISFSQTITPESESNNSFETANTVEYDYELTTTATLGSNDPVDYFKLPSNFNSNIYLYISGTNIGSSPATLGFVMYNGLTFYPDQLDPQEIYSKNLTNQQIAPGETFYDTIVVCGLAIDNYYVKFSSTGSFDYNFQWFPANATVNDEPNNSFETANEFTYNVEERGGIRYEFWGNTDYDAVDYFRSVLPAADYANTRLTIQATYNGCDYEGRIQYYLYKNNTTTPFASGFVGDDSTYFTYQTGSSIIALSNMQAGDELYIKFTANAPFSYKFRYKETGGFEDEEYNGDYNNAIPAAEGQIHSGNVGEYDENVQEYVDQYDTYRIVLPNDGAINIKISATTLDCYEYNYYTLGADLLDEYGNSVSSKTLITWDDYPDCNNTRTDSVKIRAIVAGTYYLRLNTDYSSHSKINYTFSYTRADSCVNIDPEPNYAEQLAVPITAGEIRGGHVNFIGSAYDFVDYYKATFPGTGRLTVYLKSINRYESAVSAPLNITVNGYSGSSLAVQQFTSLQPDSSYTDTIRFCGIAGGTIYFQLRNYNSGSLPFEYVFSYAVGDTTSAFDDAEPNNSYSQARLIGANAVKKGRINFGQFGSDGDDYYKLVYSTPDSLIVPWQATNASCYGNRSITMRGYNKNFQQIFIRTLNNVNSDQLVFDTLRYKVLTTDTIYLRFQSGDYAFQYQFKTNPRVPSSVFSIVGDSSVCHGAQVYHAINIADEPVTYNWSLPLGGGTISFSDSTATVNWTTDGNRSVQLVLSNASGNSQTKTRTVIVNGAPPTQVPVAYNFARTLSTADLPPGTTCQWFRNDTAIAGATNPSYYAAAAGSFTVKFVNDCGEGPASNAIVFNAAALPQVISFPHTPTVTMSPTAKVIFHATSSSGLPVFYQKVSGGGYIQNDTLYVVGNSIVGQIIVKATQPGDDIYLPAPDKYDTITVIKGSQVISFDAVPPQVFGGGFITLNAVSTAQLGLLYNVVSGNAEIYYSYGYPTNYIYLTGVGPVTVRASHPGNDNYNPAVPVDRTFCVGVGNLAAISGDANPCLSTYRYTTLKIKDAVYVWTLSSGGILTTHDDTAWVQWQTPGTHSIKVKAKSTCDPVFSPEEFLVINTSNNGPSAVSGMIPENNAIDRQLPLTLSWIPGNNTVSYDLYIWDSAVAQPSVPFAANIQNVSYVLPVNSLVQNRTNKWYVVSKNPCAQISGPVQKFKVIPSPDLTVSNVSLPATATSGQTISVSWKVTNNGPGRTKLNEHWNDGVYLSRDTIPNFNFPPLYDPAEWNNLVTNDHRPLLIGKPQNVSALDSGQFYTNSLQFTLPLAYSQTFYAYVITDNGHPNSRIKQVTVTNDTAHAAQPMIVTILPTPDLRTDTVVSPLSAFSGSTINLAYKVKNYGVLTPAGSAWTDSVFISQNPLFDRTQSIWLNAPKSNGSYYPNAPGAVSGSSVQLRQDSFYTRNLPVVIPNNIFGTWFIYVKSNATASLYEGAFVNNNVGKCQIQVYLTPTPKLTVSSLTIPVTQAATTQPIGASWNIFNEGLYDNREFNKGHYLLNDGSCPTACGPGAPPNSQCLVPRIRDSIVRGSSFWKDRVYLSRDASGLNVATAWLIGESDHGVLNSGLFIPDQYPLCGTNPANINVATVIKPGSNFPKNINFSVPDSLQPGDYYVYVYTNPTKTVFEYPGTPQIKRSASPIAVVRPDLIVSSVSAPAAVSGGVPITVNYTIQNNGPGAVFNHIRRDRIYVSSFNSFDGSAQLIETKTYTEDVPVGSVNRSFNYVFPPASSGLRYFYVHTNFDSSFRETNSLNNVSASGQTLVSAATASDLVCTSVIIPDSVFTMFKNVVTYTIKNNGSGTASGAWTDSVYFSCNAVFGNANNNFAGKKLQTRLLAAGESYTDTIQITIPEYSYEINSCFPRAASATAYFFVKANANGGTYEGTNVNNNVTVAGSRILVNPLIDHVVLRVNGSDTTTVGRPYQTSWTLKNIGYNVSRYYDYFSDGVYFSPDSVLNASAVLSGNYLKYNRINRFDSLYDTKAVTTPNLPTGDYYVFVYTNYSDQISGELNRSNNINFIRNAAGAAKKIHLIRPLLPDLTDSIMSAPASVAAGQPFTIIHKVTNRGAGVTFPASWRHHMRLSTDFLAGPNDGDRQISDKNHNGALSPGQSYIDTVTATLPISVTDGNYILISYADGNNNVIESADNNNLSFSQLAVYHTPESDLLPVSIRHPDTVYLGYTIDTLKWAVNNYSTNQAIGQTSDGIYLSKSVTLDSTAVLIGIKNKTISILPLDSLASVLSPFVNNVAEGPYRVFVKADILNQIPESNKDNNTAISPVPIYVKAKELPLNVLTPNTLQRTARYYKLVIPDSLIGYTIRVMLRTGDSLLVRNEMFIGAGYIPTPARYTYRYDTPNYGNQSIVMSSVLDSVYYIVYNCITPTTPVQNVTLKAEKLPFAILNVNSGSGGNIGNVTVRISGSLFRDSMTATLTKSGTVINASAVYFTNSTTVYATFNLQGKPLGVYDVTLRKPNGAEAVLAGSFSIVPANNGGLITGSGANTGAGNGNEPGCDPGAASGLNSQLVVELVVPERVLLQHPVLIQINFSNPTNFDIPAQSRTLFNDANMKMAFTREGVPTGTTSLYMELSEAGGPPGIIRAGGSGTITIYTFTPDRIIGDAKKLFRLL